MFKCVHFFVVAPTHLRQRFNSSEEAVSALGNLEAFSDAGVANVTVSASGGGYHFEVYPVVTSRRV